MSNQEHALAVSIEKHQAEIVARWLDRVRRDVQRAGQHVSPTDLRDAVGDYLSRLAEALRQETSASISGAAAWKRIAREHALTRVRVGFDIDQLVHEFVLLRSTIEEVVSEHGLELSAGLVSRLADLIEAAIATAVRTYVESRDYQLRAREAEHIGFLTHELRNPLSTASMAAAQLPKASSPDARERALLDTLGRSLERLRQMIDNVLMSERLEVSEVRPQPIDVSLGRIMDDALRAARDEARRKGLVMEARYDPDLVVHVDPGLTTSALQNLVDNAVKFTDEGRVDVEVERRGPQLRIDVRDTCPGISPEEIATIFEPFRRGHSGKPGTGLGLAIASRAVRAQGGSIDAESGAEAGCHFCVTLPG